MCTFLRGLFLGVFGWLVGFCEWFWFCFLFKKNLLHSRYGQNQELGLVCRGADYLHNIISVEFKY